MSHTIAIIIAALSLGSQVALADTIQIPTVTSYDVSATTESDVSVTIFLNATSTTSGATLIYSVESPPAHGSLGTLSADGRILYTPDPDYSGPDTFTYKATQLPVFASNISTASITINAAAPIDTTPPVITAPATQYIATTTFPALPVLSPATAIDDMDPNPSIAYEPLQFAAGTTTVVWTATDAHGNSASTTSLVVVTDPTPASPVESAAAPAGNGPPVGFISAPVNVPPPPAPEPSPADQASPAVISATAPETATTAIATTNTATSAPMRTTPIHIAVVHVASVQSETSEVPQGPGAAAAALAAAATAAPVRSFDYIGLSVLLLLVLVAVFYEWRRERRDERAAL
jgi:hypothetical protein